MCQECKVKKAWTRGKKVCASCLANDEDEDIPSESTATDTKRKRKAEDDKSDPDTRKCSKSFSSEELVTAKKMFNIFVNHDDFDSLRDLFSHIVPESAQVEFFEED